MFSRSLGALFAALALAMPTVPTLAQPAPASEVLVVGGTPAGVAAALAAARRGEDVTLVARGKQLGGVLTDAMMDQWDLNLTPSGAEVEGGIFREVYAILGDSFTPAQAAAAFAGLVAAEPRIRVIYDARPVAVDTTDADGERSVDRVTFEGVTAHRSFDLSAASIVDATDDGDVAALAGAAYDVGRQDTGHDELMQPVTLMFALTGVDWTAVVRDYAPALYGAGGAGQRRAWGYGKLMDDYHPLSSDVLVRDLNFGHEDGGSVTVNAIDILGIDGRSQSELALARAIAEREAPNLIAFLRERVPGFRNARISRYAEAIYVRETRHFQGVERLTADAIWDGSIPSDTIGLSSYPLDLHPVTAADRLAYAPIRHVYGVPFGALVPRGFANLILASPAISASHIASGSARVIPTTIEEGEAAGAAAAFARTERISFAALAARPAAIDALQEDLRRHGAILAAADTRA